MSGFPIRLEADYFLSADEIWPDGDAPDNPTSADVAAAMEACGSKQRVLYDWNISDVIVTVNDVEVWS